MKVKKKIQCHEMHACLLFVYDKKEQRRLKELHMHLHHGHVMIIRHTPISLLKKKRGDSTGSLNDFVKALK